LSTVCQRPCTRPYHFEAVSNTVVEIKTKLEVVKWVSGNELKSS